MLPLPTNTRFQPLRSGLINLFKYENQEFWYERGRLLIRGNNGTGKSRVLALQLPFLLDGEISPRRVEPDGDPARQIAWHLTMDDYNDRTGYTGIEFGRRDETGAEHYVTLGCGMRAVRGGDNQPTRWFFVTERRVGADFALVDGVHPLTAERLTEVLGPKCIFKTAQKYREEIDARLFSLKTERYEALIELLIRLRAPQLSKKLDERTIFAALSDALPPLSSVVVENVATAFKQLDELREQFTALLGLSQSLAGFQSGYQSYLQTALSRRAERVRSCHSKYETAQGAVNDLERTIEAGQLRHAEAEQVVAQCEVLYAAADARFEAVNGSDKAADAGRLDDSQRFAKSAADIFEQAQTRSQDAATKFDGVEREFDEQNEGHKKATALRDAAWIETTRLSKPAGISIEHARLVPDDAAWKDVAKLRRTYESDARNHLHRIDQIDAGLSAVATAQNTHTAKQLAENRIALRVEELNDAVQRHEETAQNALGALAIAYPEWRAQLQRIAVPPWSALAPAFTDWLETDDDSHRVLSATVENAHRDEVNAIAGARATVNTERKALADERNALIAERDLLAHSAPPPVAPATRDPSARANRPGAPLWQLCEFRLHLSLGEQAGLEAALEASGLLDAWVTPDGNITGELPVDTFLAAGQSRADMPTLADWLIPEPQNPTAISPSVILRVLARIGAGASSGEHWVALDGRWQLGPVFGRGEKKRPQHLGASSREVARRQRLAEIETAMEVLATREAGLNQHDSVINTREQVASDERDQAPTDSDIARCLTLRTDARKQRDAVSVEHSSAVQETYRARTAFQQADEKLKQDAKHLGYGEHLDALSSLRPAWTPYELAVAKLWGEAQAWSTATIALENLHSRRLAYAEEHTRAKDQALEAQTAAVRADETFRTLQSILGSSIRDFQTELQQAREARVQAYKSLEGAKTQVSTIQNQIVALTSSLAPAQTKVTEADAARSDAIQALRVPLIFGLFPEAHASLADIEADAWSPTRAYAIARRIGKDLPETDTSDEAWTKRLDGLESQIHDLRTRTGTSCEIESRVLSEGLTMVECRYQSLKLKPAECLAAVVGERETRERLLNASESEIIDRHLITEVSMQLQKLIEDAQTRTVEMNKEMTRCATTLGVTLRLGWEPLTEGVPPGLSAARKLLLVDHATWTPNERTAVGEFLRQLIQNERIENPTETPAEQLQRALDYRQWHTFYADRHQNGRWERLTKKRYGTGSGGEKALMLTIPQMAAAASHYSAAAPHAPRFILLDEAFAGMDPPTRARLMGLLEAFDLDLMMTSEREWGTHSTVPGIAIYQLFADADAIATTRWIWNGKTRLLAPVPDTHEARPPTLL